jgi:hypothetical protein
MDGPIAVKAAIREMLDIEDDLEMVMVIPMGVPESTEVEAPERLPVEAVIRYHSR